MILAFLMAEIDSPRHAEGLISWFGRCGGDRTLIEAGDPTNADENAIRRCILRNFRGYRNADTPALFPGFPGFVLWKLVALSSEDIAKLKYAAWPTWVELSGGTRLVADGAANLETIEIADVNVHVREVIKEIDAGSKIADYQPTIIVATHTDAQHVVVEGHTRLTAFCARLQVDDEVTALAGYSANMNNWGLMKV
jgi:hypothetical protein